MISEIVSHLNSVGMGQLAINLKILFEVNSILAFKLTISLSQFPNKLILDRKLSRC
jgi:hypothetical protein